MADRTNNPPTDRMPLMADILMGAAYADNELEGVEKNAVRDLLKGVLHEPSLPMDLEFRIDEFSPAAFDLGQTAAAFVNDTPEQKRALLQLVAAVHAADNVHDFAEDDYLRRVGAALGLDESHYRDLVATILEEVDLPRDLRDVRFGS